MGLAAIAALSLTTWAMMEGVLVKHLVKKGDTMKYKMSSEMDAGTMTAVVTDTVTSVTDAGDYIVESKMTEAKFGDMDIQQYIEGFDTTTYSSSGEVLKAAGAGNTNREAHIKSLPLPTTPLNVGDTWTHDFKKDDAGGVNAKGTYKVEAREMVGTHDTFRIHISMKEAIDQDPASVDEQAWIDIKDGSLVKSTGTLTNLPIPQMGPMTMKVTITRMD
jgi:hypothetical protein